MSPKLSILVAALTSRSWYKIISELWRQVEESHLRDRVQIVYELDNGEATSGVKRQRLVNQAQGEYIAFVDDDDWVANDYVRSLVEGTRSGADVITFNLQLRDEVWSYGIYKHDNRDAGLMNANHLCAWRQDLARLVGWCPYLGYGDDQLWYKTLHIAGVADTQYHIHRTLYQYQFDQNVTVNQQFDKFDAAIEYAGDGLRCFWDMEPTQILVESGNKSPFLNMTNLIDNGGQEICVDEERLNLLTLIGTVNLSTGRDNA